MIFLFFNKFNYYKISGVPEEEKKYTNPANRQELLHAKVNGPS